MGHKRKATKKNKQKKENREEIVRSHKGLHERSFQSAGELDKRSKNLLHYQYTTNIRKEFDENTGTYEIEVKDLPENLRNSPDWRNANAHNLKQHKNRYIDHTINEHRKG